MPKWNSLARETLYFNPYQDAFWKARQLRYCSACGTEYQCPPVSVCPSCQRPGVRKFHRLVIVAGRRGGKTLAGAVAGCEEASIPNTIGWACAPTNPKLHRYVIPAFQQLIPNDWVQSWSSEHLDLRLKNGSLIHFQTLEDPNQGRGQGLDWLWIDEVCELTDMHWHVIRPSLTERRGVAFFTTSPQSYDWVYDQFYKPAENGVPGFWACRYKTSDNPIISAAELADAKATMPDALYRQEYEADFVIFTGAVYGSTIDEQILRSDDEVRRVIPEWPTLGADRSVLVGLDSGADHPFGALKVVSTERGLVCVGEYLQRHRPVIQHALELKALAASSNIRWAINKTEAQIILELAQHGIFCQPSENDLIAGIERIKTWLHTKQLWFVESKVPLTIRQMRSYRWADNTARDGSLRAKEKVYKKEDELPDCLRYALMTWPQLPSAVDPKPTGRDPATVPESLRPSWERMQRINKRDDPDKEPTVAEDFWL